MLCRSVLEEHCRLRAVLGFGALGKISLARPGWPRPLHQAFEHLYWGSLSNAPPVTEWLSGAIGFLSDQQLVRPLRLRSNDRSGAVT
jgi:hypothetical protein